MRIRQILSEKFINGQLTADEIVSHIHTVPLVHPDFCANLADAHKESCQKPNTTTDNFRAKGMLSTTYGERIILKHYLNLMVMMIRDYYSDDVKLEFAGVSCILPGGRPLIPHVDNTKWDGQQYIDNHTPRRAYTCIVYLNDNFGGGETVYGRDNEGHVKSIPYEHVVKPKTGYANFRPCGEFYYHCVDVVHNKPRYALVAWFCL